MTFGEKATKFLSFYYRLNIVFCGKRRRYFEKCLLFLSISDQCSGNHPQPQVLRKERMQNCLLFLFQTSVTKRKEEVTVWKRRVRRGRFGRPAAQSPHVICTPSCCRCETSGWDMTRMRRCCLSTAAGPALASPQTTTSRSPTSCRAAPFNTLAIGTISPAVAPRTTRT